MTTKSPASIAALLIAGLVASAAYAADKPPALKGSELASKATVTLPAARAAALKARPGTITDEELEAEKGGSGLRYSFDVKSHGKTYEVGVDARTGKILEDSPEGKNPD